MQDFSYKCIPENIPFEQCFSYLSHNISLPFMKKPKACWSAEDLFDFKNHEARLTAVFYLENKPRNEWTQRDSKILAAARSGSDMIAVHDGDLELIDF